MPTLSQLFARRFIARPDAVALQRRDGTYAPYRKKKQEPLIPFSTELIDEHIAGSISVGHYLLNPADQCKFFAFDVDLREIERHPDTKEITWQGKWVQGPTGKDLESVLEKFPEGPKQQAAFNHLSRIHDCDPRELWQDKKHPSRTFFLIQMTNLARMLARRITDEYDIPVVCSYSGHKGFHVYGLHGMLPAKESRVLGYAILDSFDRFRPTKGDNFFVDENDDPATGFANFSIELFPKQDSIRENGFGNLMRLDLGKNLKAPTSPTFLFDLTHPTLRPHSDPKMLLESGNPWGN